MSSTPQPGRADRTDPSGEPAPSLVFDDPLTRPSRDDTDEGWGDAPSSEAGGAGDLARFLAEKPPHHL